MKITIGHLYPDLLNLYGDRGNIQCLMKRCQWRGIEAETIPFELDDKIDFSKLDIVLLGGGSDREQMIVCEQLREIQKDFKKGNIDILVVYNMLLTGFDAPRLKKLYLARMIKAHNLLQTLTRVNRPYKSYHYGFVVDFANIKDEFDKTNKAYFDELQAELGDELQNYSNIFKSREETNKFLAEYKGE